MGVLFANSGMHTISIAKMRVYLPRVYSAARIASFVGVAYNSSPQYRASGRIRSPSQLAPAQSASPQRASRVQSRDIASPHAITWQSAHPRSCQAARPRQATYIFTLRSHDAFNATVDIASSRKRHIKISRSTHVDHAAPHRSARRYTYFNRGVPVA